MARKAVNITQAELDDAIRRFRAAGGLVQKLPDQPDPLRNQVGGRWGMYEPVMENFQPVASSD